MNPMQNRPKIGPPTMLVNDSDNSTIPLGKYSAK